MKIIKKEKKRWLHLQRQSNIPRATMHMSQIKNHAYESNKKRIRTNIGKWKVDEGKGEIKKTNRNASMAAI